MFFCVLGSPAAAVIYVDTGGDDITGDGTPGAPYGTIQHAVDMAFGPSDTVSVSPGTYVECVDATGKTGISIVAEDGDRLVAGALNLVGRDTLFGRNWGCAEEFRFLHFEACYYRAIDYAIGHGLTWVEAGAQGPHKVQRGYLPRLTYSAHWIADPGLRDAVADFLHRERRGNELEMEALARHSPYRRIADDPGPR